MSPNTFPLHFVRYILYFVLKGAYDVWCFCTNLQEILEHIREFNPPFGVTCTPAGINIFQQWFKTHCATLWNGVISETAFYWAFFNTVIPWKTNTVAVNSTSHAVSGKWAENNPGTAEQAIQHFCLSWKKTKMNPGFALVRCNQSCTRFIWSYLQSWHCRLHLLRRSHCWLLLLLRLHISFHVWRKRMRKWEVCLR